MTAPVRFLAAALLLSGGCTAERPPAAPATVATVAPSIQAAPDQFFIHDSVRIRYREAGQGEAVVLVHGYADRIEALEGLADSLGPTYRVIVLDLRGFGESTKLADPVRYGRPMTDDVIALLDHLQISKAHLVGHSMGALIAADVALRYPARTASASLLGGPFYPDSAAFAKKMDPYIAKVASGKGLTAFALWLFPGMPDSVAADLSRQALAANDIGSLLAVMRAMGGLMVPPGAKPDPAIRVLFAAGTGDPLLPLSRTLQARWPGSRLVEVPGSNHDEVHDRGEAVAAIRALLRG